MMTQGSRLLIACATIIYRIWILHLHGKRRKSKENGLEKFLSRKEHMSLFVPFQDQYAASISNLISRESRKFRRAVCLARGKRSVSIYLVSTTRFMLYRNKIWNGRKILTF